MQSLWMLFASFVFAIMGVCVKLASTLYSTSEIVMYRGIVGVIFMFVMIRLHRGSLKTSLPWHHAWRGAVGVMALWLWFYSISLLPLPTAVTLNYTAPIWIAAILFFTGWRQGAKRFDWRMVAAVLMSFAGVVMLLRPTIGAEQWLGGVIALISGMLSALAYLQVRALGRMGEPDYRVVFYFSLTGLVAGLVGTLLTPAITGTDTQVWHPHTPYGIALLLGVGVCATVAQVAMTRAYRLGNTLVTANLQYTGIVFSSIWGILLWKDVLGWLSWTGVSVILASGIAATYYNTRDSKVQDAEASDAIATEI
jgi:S-adenosylmethionine uptake transporter